MLLFSLTIRVGYIFFFVSLVFIIKWIIIPSIKSKRYINKVLLIIDSSFAKKFDKALKIYKDSII
mgnify:FL=1